MHTRHAKFCKFIFLQSLTLAKRYETPAKTEGGRKEGRKREREREREKEGPLFS
jgi:hypothetical protein